MFLVVPLKDSSFKRLRFGEAQQVDLSPLPTLLWEFVIEKYKKKGFDLDGELLQRIKGTTTGERWTEEDDALAAAVEEFGRTGRHRQRLLSVALLYSAAGGGITSTHMFTRNAENGSQYGRRVVKEGG